MNNINIERALTCRLIDSYMKQHGLVGPMTTEHLAKVSWHIVELLTSIQVRELYEENAFHNIDVERHELYEVYAPRLVDRFAAALEAIATPCYTLGPAEISYTTRPGGSGGLPTEVTIGLKGENLLDDDVRNHVSFKKDEVLQPGRSIRMFGSIKLN